MRTMTAKRNKHLPICLKIYWYTSITHPNLRDKIFDLSNRVDKQSV